jgi:hypothetical protein
MPRLWTITKAKTPSAHETEGVHRKGVSETFTSGGSSADDLHDPWESRTSLRQQSPRVLLEPALSSGQKEIVP